MFIELHLIQNFAPSNLNRDDTNNPKDCVFGGARRARISSQSLKRAIRTTPAFENTVGMSSGVRTKLIAGEFEKRFIAWGAESTEARQVAEALAFAHTPADKPKKGDGEPETAGKTQVLIYFSPEEIDALTRRVWESWPDILLELAGGNSGAIATIITEEEKEARKRPSAPDIALFGRMLANRPETNIDAACQVAHAISTHAVSMDIDFFTAVDDLQPGGETGSSMMGVTGFNSATFYRYSRLDWDQLIANLYGDVDLACRTVEGFLRAAVEAIPSGKQNSFAAHNRPDFHLGVVRDHGMAWSLANAFERPVYGGKSGLLTPSVKALDNYWGQLARVYGFDGRAAALKVSDAIELDRLAPYEVADFETWVSSLLGALPQG